MRGRIPTNIYIYVYFNFLFIYIYLHVSLHLQHVAVWFFSLEPPSETPLPSKRTLFQRQDIETKIFSIPKLTSLIMLHQGALPVVFMKPSLMISLGRLGGQGDRSINMSFLAQGSWGTSRTAMVLLGAPGSEVRGYVFRSWIVGDVTPHDPVTDSWVADPRLTWRKSRLVKFGIIIIIIINIITSRSHQYHHHHQHHHQHESLL